MPNGSGRISTILSINLQFGCHIVSIQVGANIKEQAYFLSIEKSEKTLICMRDGRKYYLRRGDKPVFTEVCIADVYGSDGQRIKDEDLVIDIRAHIGCFGIQAATGARRGHVYCLEPVEENYDMLCINAQVHGLTNLTATKMVVSNEEGTREIAVHENNMGGGSFYIKGKGEKVLKVTTTTLNALFMDYHLQRVSWLKIDCKGAEYEILMNCPDDLFTKIGRMCLEYHYFDEKRPEILTQLLSSKGYNITTLKVKPPYDRSLGGLIFATKPSSRV